MSADRTPMVMLTTVWQRTSAAGRRFSGYLGASQLVIFDDGEHPYPTRPGETVHVWKMLLQERDQTPRQQPSTRNATRGEAVHDRARDAGRAQRAGEAVLAAAGHDPRPEPSGDFYRDSASAIADLRGRP